MANPRITIETVLEKVKQSDIQTLEKQLKSVSKASLKSQKSLKKFLRETDAAGVVKVNKELGKLTRQFTVHEAVTRITTRRMNTWREAMQLGGIVIRDFTTKVGFLNAFMNIMVSRFGTMIVVFAAFTKINQIFTSVKESFLSLDTAFRKVASLIVPAAGTVEDAMKSLGREMIDFALEVGVSFEQLSDTMFFLASAGLNSAQVLSTFRAAQKLVIGSAKDMTASMEENKKAVEILAGLFNVYGDTLQGFNNEQEKAERISGILFQAFKTQQILLTELAVGLSFAGSQAKVSGISLQELVASIAILNTSLVKGSKAGTSYANAIRDATRNAGKLRELFDVDISGIGRNFSLLETVVDGVSRRIRQTGVNITLLTDLMQVFNIRGLRSMVVLADQIDEVRKLIRGMENGVENLNTAIETVTKSYKFQRQRLINISQVLGTIFNIAITGGKTTRGILESWNDILQENIRNFLKVSSVIVIITFSLLTAARAVRLLGLEIKQLPKIFSGQAGLGGSVVVGLSKTVTQTFGSKGRKEIKGNLDKFVEATKESLKQVELLIREAWVETGAKSIEEYKTIFDSANTRILSGLADQLLAQEDYVKALKATFPILRRNLTLIERASGLEVNIPVGFAPSEETKTKLLKGIADAVKEAEAKFKISVPGEDFLLPPVAQTKTRLQEILAVLVTEHQVFADKIVGIMRTAGEKGFAQALIDTFRADVDPELDKQLENFSTLMFRRAAVLESEFRKEALQFEKGSQELLGIQAKFAIDYQDLVEETFAGARQITLKELRKQSADISKEVRKSTDQLKNFLRDVNKQVAGFSLSSIQPSDIFTLSIEDIVPKFTDFERRLGLDKITIALEGIEGDWDRIVGDAAKSAIQELQKQFNTFGVERVKLQKALNDDLETEIILGLASTKKLIRTGFADREQELLDSLKRSLFALINAEDDQLAILAKASVDKLNFNEKDLKQLEEAVVRTGVAQKDSIVLTINAIRSLDKQMIKLLLGLDEGALADFVRQVAIETNFLNLALSNGEKAAAQVRKEFADFNTVIGESFLIFQDLTFIIGNEFADNIQKTIDALGLFSDSIQQVSNSISELKAEMAKAEASGNAFQFSFASFGSTLGIISGVTGLIGGLISIFRSRKDETKRALTEEFLPDDATSRIAADFGQARVVNQRITLNPIFQFLDASQLSQAAQRRLAFTIFDEIQELQKAAG